MTDVVGNPEEERRAEFYHEPWSQEAVSRYFYCKVTCPGGGEGRSLPISAPSATDVELLYMRWVGFMC